MGMPVRIRLYCPTDEAAKTVASAAFARVAVLDQMMSDYRPDSELSRLGTAGDTWSIVSPELFEVLERAVEVARATGGAFDPTVGPAGRDLARRAQEPAHARRDCAGVGKAPRRLATHPPRRLAPRGSTRHAGHASGSRWHRQGLHPSAGARLDGVAWRHASPRRGWRRHRRRRRPARSRRVAHRRGWCRCAVRRARRAADERGARDLGTRRAIRRDRRPPILARRRSANRPGFDEWRHCAGDRPGWSDRRCLGDSLHRGRSRSHFTHPVTIPWSRGVGRPQ